MLARESVASGAMLGTCTAAPVSFLTSPCIAGPFAPMVRVEVSRTACQGTTLTLWLPPA